MTGFRPSPGQLASGIGNRVCVFVSPPIDLIAPSGTAGRGPRPSCDDDRGPWPAARSPGDRKQAASARRPGRSCRPWLFSDNSATVTT